MTVHVCSPASVVFRHYARCRICRRRRRHVAVRFVWYDAMWTCCTCGTTSVGGERCRLSPSRRRHAAAKARADWRAAPSRDVAEAAFRALVEEPPR